VYRLDDFRAKLASNNTWAREVVETPKLFLIGGAFQSAARLTTAPLRSEDAQGRSVHTASSAANQCTNNAIKITIGSGMPINSNRIERMVFSFD